MPEAGGVPSKITEEQFNELAARLGSINTYDRRGTVVWFDDFEGAVLKWTPTIVGAGTAALSSVNPLNGSGCCRLVTGNVIADFTRIDKTLWVPNSDQMGFEVAISHLFGRIVIGMIVFRGSIMYEAYLLLNISDPGGPLGIAIISGGTTTVLSAPSFINNPMYHRMKLVVDVGIGRFVRAMVDGFSFDLSAYALTAATPAVGGTMTVTIRYGTGVALANTADVDDAIVTKDEPANPSS